jgi:hypothetical protein
MNPCNLSGIFGSPNTGLHSYRVMNIAVVDVLSVAILAAILAKLLPMKQLELLGKYPVMTIALILLIIGVIAHRVFCVRTTIDKLLFPEA